MAYTTIDNPELYFQVKTYSGTGSSNAITFDGDENMQPDLVWIKSRNHAYGHHWTDSVRGAGKDLYSDITDDEYSNANSLTSFDSDGFTVGSDNGVNNGSSKTYVAWCWKMNGSGSSNTEGSLNTTANSVDTTAGQSIISYTGNGTDGATIGHGLDTAPDVLILKDRDNTRNWRVLHTGWADASKNMLLNTTGAPSTRADDFNSTYPSSTLITLGGDAAVNGNTTKYIIYAFSSVQGYSKFGSYTGNGNANGTYVHLGFRPAMIIIKTTSGSDRWVISDNKRDTDNPVVGELNPNDGAVEDTSSTPFDFLSNGFRLRRTGNVFNTSGHVYVYMAFAEAPFVNSKGVPCNAR